jgi:hypothetical protein
MQDIRDDVGQNVLRIASAKGFVDICRCLIQEGPGLDVNSRSTGGWLVARAIQSIPFNFRSIASD